MTERLTFIVFAAVTSTLQNPIVIIVTSLVLAAVILVTALFLYRNSGKKKPAKADKVARTPDWQRQGQQGAAGTWNQPGAAGQADNWAQQQPGAWAAQAPAQQRPGAWGTPKSDPQPGGWGEPAVNPQPGGWETPQSSASAWGQQASTWNQPATDSYADDEAQPGVWGAQTANPQASSWGTPKSDPQPGGWGVQSVPQTPVWGQPAAEPQAPSWNKPVADSQASSWGQPVADSQAPAWGVQAADSWSLAAPQAQSWNQPVAKPQAPAWGDAATSSRQAQQEEENTSSPLQGGFPSLTRPTIHIFISHSSKDEAFGTRLVQDLRQAVSKNSTIWYDSDGGLNAGDRWFQRIEEAIVAHDKFLIILSPNSMDSDWVRREYDIALNEKKPIIPILHQDCPSIWPSLKTIHYISFLHPKRYETAFNELLTALGLSSDTRAKKSKR